MRQNIPVASELKPAELRAWRAFLDAQAILLRRLEAELVAGEGMTLAEFDVLAQLGLASDGRLRMTELSERVRLSRSGITRLVDRLVRAGLVKRGNCATDRRGTWAILTPTPAPARRPAAFRPAAVSDSARQARRRARTPGG